MLNNGGNRFNPVTNIGVSLDGDTQNGWFITEYPIKIIEMNDLDWFGCITVISPFQETSII